MCQAWAKGLSLRHNGCSHAQGLTERSGKAEGKRG